MNGERWRFVKERAEAGCLCVRLFASEDVPGRFRRVSALSRAGTSPKGLPRDAGAAWCVVEYCHRGEDGELSPWRQEWEHRLNNQALPQGEN